MRKLFFFLIVLLFSNGLFALDQAFSFKRFTTAEGLSNSWIRCFHQDLQGYIWIGTADGLNRFDGRNFTIYRPTNDKGFNFGNITINDIAQKDYKTLWIATDIGLYEFDLLHEQMILNESLSTNPVLCIENDNNDNYWFGTNHGLFQFNQQTNKQLYHGFNQLTIREGRSNDYVNCVTVDSKQNKWVGTKEGLNKINHSTGTIETFTNNKEVGSISGNNITKIVEDKNGNIWVATMLNGLNRISTKNNKTYFEKIIDGPIQSIAIDHKNKMWIAHSSERGIELFDLTAFNNGKKEIKSLNNDPLIKTTISDNSIFTLFIDKNKDVWLGTFGNGFNYFSYRTKAFRNVGEIGHPNFTIQNSLVNTFCDDEKYLWIGTEGGLDRLDKNTKRIDHYNYESDNPNSLTSNPILDIYKDSRNNLWVGTWAGGLNKYNYETNEFKRYTPDDKPGSISSRHVFKILEDSKSNLWIGTNSGGLNLFDYETETFKTFRNDPSDSTSLQGRSVNYIYETQNGVLLVALYNTLEIFNYETESFTHVNRNENSSYNMGNISSIFEDSQQNVWLATNAGLELYNSDIQLIKVYTTLDGLPDNTIQSIQEDNSGNLWLSTNNGISKFINGISPNNNPLFYNFSKDDGLAAVDYKQRAAIKDENGMLYFGSSNGYTYFAPDSILLNTNAPKVVFTGLSIQYSQPNANSSFKPIRKNLNMQNNIELYYPDVDFTIGFAALNYLNSENNSYQYKLEGYDTEWINADRKMSATYTNLSEGKFTFKVLASNNDNVWCSSPKTLNITIYPPWWKSKSFKILIWVIAFFSGVSFIYIRFASINRENKELEARVDKRTTELSRLNVLLEEKQKKIKTQNLELEKHRDHLEELVEVRTAELAQALSRAEESDHLKSSFLANMSHEIRTPMNAIIGFSTMLAEKNINELKRIKYIDQIKTNGKNLNLLINDIIDISIIEAKQLKLSKSKFSVDKILLELFHIFELENNNKFEFVYSNANRKRDLFIHNDAFRFRQIMTNLLSNAFKYSDRGCIEYGYTTFDNHVQFFVKDNGIGISKKEIDRIFKHFYKAEKSKAKLYRGTGIGLSICRNLVDQMGGKIWVESQKGEGSTFFFTLALSNHV